jgi:hypothetical protein
MKKPKLFKCRSAIYRGGPEDGRCSTFIINSGEFSKTISTDGYTVDTFERALKDSQKHNYERVEDKEGYMIYEYRGTEESLDNSLSIMDELKILAGKP